MKVKARLLVLELLGMQTRYLIVNKNGSTHSGLKMKQHKWIKVIVLSMFLVAGSAVAVNFSLDSPTRFPVDI